MPVIRHFLNFNGANWTGTL